MGKNGFCNNCGATLSGQFCSACGQKIIEEKERKIGHFIYQFFGAAFFLEKNFLKDLWLLISAPGRLASDYRLGKRQSHMTPISLFLLINIIYFLMSPLSDLNLSLNDQMYQPLHGSLARKLVDSKMKLNEMSFDDLQSKYNAQSTSLSKSLVIVNVPIMALLISLVFARKKHFFFGDHMVLAYHLLGFILLLSCLIILVFIPIQKTGILSDNILSASTRICMTVLGLGYFFFSVKNFYQASMIKSFLNTFLIILIFMVSHFLYRSILFFSVFYTI